MQLKMTKRQDVGSLLLPGMPRNSLSGRTRHGMSWAMHICALTRLRTRATPGRQDARGVGHTLRRAPTTYGQPLRANTHPPAPTQRTPQHTRNRFGDPGIATEIEPIETGPGNSKRHQAKFRWGLADLHLDDEGKRHQNRALEQFHAHRRDPPGDGLLDRYGQHYPFVS